MVNISQDCNLFKKWHSSDFSFEFDTETAVGFASIVCSDTEMQRGKGPVLIDVQVFLGSTEYATSILLERIVKMGEITMTNLV